MRQLMPYKQVHSHSKPTASSTRDRNLLTPLHWMEEAYELDACDVLAII
jgi:hypothetical protein